ncbi:tandem-95 repeat protein [Shewanella waksmanii]|uniref:tandem-95 repeat protein n=1 Tax=Shewanella waksmanii TaxID=213783 RepID=UPI00048E9845|nr:tandem-95 repeat protein [Shewanella waksmanii]
MLKNITKFTISSLMFFAIQFPIYASVYDFEAGVTGIGTTTITSTVDGVTITLKSNNDTWLTGDNGNQAGTSVNVVAIDQSAGATQVSVSFSSPVTLSGMQTTDLFWTINSLTFTPTDGSGNNIFTDNNGGSSWGNNVNGHNISFASWSLPTTSFNITADTSQASNIMALVLDTIVFVEAPTNTPPTIANFNGDSFTYSEGDSAEVIDQGTALTIADSDSSDFDTGNITVTITSGEDAAEDILSIDTSGVVSLQGSTAGSNVSISGTVVGTLANNIAAGNDFVINLNSAATAARVMGLSRALTYFNSDNDNPTTGARNLRMTVDDGDGGVSINSDITATVVRVNDNPVINNLAGDTLNYDEDDGKQNIDISANASVTDVDSTNFNTGSLTVTIPTNKDASEDILGFDNSVTTAGTAGATVSVGGTNIGTLSNNIAEGNDLVVSFNSASTPALIQALVRAITYENSDNLAPTESTRTIRLLLLDGDGGSSGNIDTSVTVSAINDLPVGTSQVLTPNEGQALSITTANFGYSDPEGDTLNLVTIVAAPASGDLWLDTDGNGSINGAESALMNNATISKANLDAGQLKYFANGSASSSFSFNVNDGTNDAAGNNTITLSVNPQPTVTINQASGQADPTNSASVLFDVVFSESVTGFVSSDISLSGDVTATVTNLAGSGTTYIATATISAGQGDIVATVASDVATASSGALNKASTSTDNTVEFDNVAPSAPTALDLLASSDTGTSDSDNITNDTSPTVSGSGESDATITLFSDLDGNNSLNGVEPSITANVTANSWSATLAGLSSSDPNTLHNLKAFQTDPAGNISAVSSALAMTLDNTLPTGHTAAISTTPINSSNENALAFTLNSAEVGAAYSYTISSSGGGTAVTNLGTISSTTESFNNLDVAGLADGTLTVSVLLTDMAGNIASAVTDTVEKDTQLPSGHSVTIDQSPIVAANANAVSFTFNAAEITATYLYSFSSSNGGTPVTGTGSISQTNQQISAIDLSALADGQISLSATLTDAAGNQALAVTDTVSKDALGPVVTDVSLNTGALSVSDTVIATITFDDIVQLSDLTPTVALDIGGASRTASYASGNNSTQLVFHYDVVAGDNDSDGVTAQSITTNTATMTDANGNAAILSFTAFMEPNLIVDTTAPNAAAPTSTAQTLNADTITLSQSNYAENGITIVALADANQDGNADNSTALATDVVSTGNWSLTLPLTQDASNYFVLRAQDNAGNSSDIAVGDYLEDSTAPAVPVVSSPITTTYTQNIVLDITGTHSENGITVGLYADSDNNGIADNSSVIASDIVSGNSFTITTNLTDNSNNDFVILANDSAGNNSTAVALVTIVHDNTAPTATVDILTTSLNNPPIAGTLTDTGGLASLTYTLSDGSNNFGPYTPDTINDINSGNWKDNATDDSLADGSYDIEISLTDLAGNTATVNETDVLNIDSTSPQGYSVAIEQSRIDANNETALSFIISDGELGNQYDYSISDGSISVSGSGTISSTSETVTNVDVSTLAEGTLTLSLSLTDTANNTGEPTTASVDKIYNIAPTINQGNSVSVTISEDNSPTSFNLTLDASDIDNNPLSWSIVTNANNGNATVNGSNSQATVNYTPNTNYFGTDSFNVQVSDGALTDVITVNVTINSVNDSPTISGTPNNTISEGSNYLFIPTIEDIDSNSFTLSINSLPSWLSFNPTTGQLSGTPNNSDVGSYANLIISVTDNDGASATLSPFSITVINVNNAPVLSGNPVTSINEGSIYSFTPVLNDVDQGDTHLFAMSNLPSWLSFNTATGQLSGTPDNEDVGSYANLIISVTDNDGASASLPPFTITVVNVNEAPVISGSPNLSVLVGEAYSFTPHAADSDTDDTLSFSIANKPSWLNFNTTTGALTGVPTAENVGTSLPITLTVSDGELSATLASFNIEVIAVNRAPTTNNYGLTLAEDSSLAITPRATDEDGDPLSYRLVTPPQHGELQSNGQVWLYQPEADYNGQDSFEFTASDGEFESQVATVTLTISAVNDAPVAIVDNLSFSQNEANQYSLNVLSNDYDVDGDELSIVNASVDVGTVTIEDNQLVYQAIAGIQGSINIQYMISDGSKQTAQTIATFSLGDADNSNLPTLTLPDDIEVDSQRLFTRIDVGFATAVDSNGNPIAVKQLNKRLYFPPGHHQVYWQAEDSQGNVVTAAQSVKVNPIISLGKNAFSAENTRYTARVFLNGLAPQYPLTIPYTVSGSSDAGDHNLVHGELVISSGQTGEIMVDVFADGEQEIDETLVITLDESLNLGGQSSFTLTITENNIAPDVQLLVSQNGQQRHKIVASDELVTIDATVFDSNTEDSHHLAWQSDADALLNQATEANQFVFSSADLAEGVYKISVTVTDDADDSLSTTASVYLELVAELPPLGMADSDNDLVPDQLEGYQDSDADGIADYLDHIADCNVLQQDLSLGNYFLKETDPGLCIRKGQYTASNQSGGSLLNQAEVSNRIDQDEQAQNVGGIFDFIIYGLPIAGQSAHVVIPQQQPLPSTAVYRKYFTNAGWGDFITDSNNLVHSAAGEPGYCPPPQHESWTEGLTRGHWCVQLTIEDGGPNDDDGIANGTIVDPSGVAVSNLNNSAPIAVEDTVALLANETINIDVLANDTDADNDQLSIVNASVDIGLVVIENDQLIYTAADDYLGQALINYSIDDNNGGSAYATVTVTISSNTPPTANDDEAQTDDRTNIHIDVLNNDVDAENDELTIISANAEMGSVSITSNNHILYQPQSGFEGTDIVHYTISDSAGAQSSAQVTVTVTAYKEVIVESKNSGGQLGGLSLLLLAMFSLWRHRNKLSLILLLLLSPKVIASGWYVDAELGYSSANFDRPHTNVATLLTFDNTDLSWSLGVGYQLSDNWKISARYIDLGSASAQYSLDTLTPDAPSASLDAAAPVLGDGLGIDVQYALWQHEAFSAWLMLGGFYWQYENQLSVIDSNFINQQEDEQLDPYFGLAMSFPITQHWHSGISFKRFALQQNDVDSLYLSVSYYF